jgi:hypothetical protein
VIRSFLTLVGVSPTKTLSGYVMRIASPFAVFTVISLGVSVYACNPSPPRVAVVPVSLDEEHCWWAVYRTSLPLDTVVDRFARAFTSIGFAPSAPSQVSDTAWINVGPSRISGYEGRSIEARIVAYRVGDSTHFRTFVATGPSQAIELCQQISRAAPVGGVTLREPDGEEKLSVWRRRP